MPLYINDQEVSLLAKRLAESSRTSKTEIVRRLLRAEARRLERKRTAEKRARVLNNISERAASFVRKGAPLSYTKQDADAMFAYLDAEPVRSHRMRK